MIGAAVVVVLLVIFLPMLLVEEEPIHSVSEQEMTIPPPPDFDQGDDASVMEPPVEPAVSTFSEYEGAEDPSLPRELPPPEFFEAPATGEPESIPEPDLVPSAPKPAPARPSAPARSSPGSSSWVIQVASVRERARAHKLVQDLRVKGFPAYIQEARVNQKLWYRIRIGPEATRKRIESLAASLRTKTGMRGQIQRHP